MAHDPVLVTPPAIKAKATPRAWGVLLMLTCVYTFSWIDRSLLIILIDPISKDLKVSNTEIGLLTGFVAALLYALAGFPIARMADKGTRRIIITSALATWSALTALSGAVTNFIGLALARFGISISSAGCTPAAYSMISDYFPQSLRGTAIAIYSLGISLGMWAGLTLGGNIAQLYGWRAAFVALGLPGVLVAIIFFLVVKEPKRGTYDTAGAQNHREYSLAEAASYIIRNPSFLAIATGFGLIAAGNSAFEYWVPTYMIRVHQMSTADVGSISGLLQGVTGFVGTLVFGFTADRLGLRSPRWYIGLPIIGFCIVCPATLMFFHTTGQWTYVCYFIREFFGSAFSAPLFTAGQLLLPPRLRALGMATMLFLLNVVGMGSGPFLAGLLSDVLKAQGAAEGLAPALMLMQICGFVGMLFLILAVIRLKVTNDRVDEGQSQTQNVVA